MRPTSNTVWASSIAVILSACNFNADSSRPASVDRLDADKDLFADPTQALGELKRRLSTSIAVRDDFLLVRNPLIADLDLAIMPARAFWVLHCGIGISISFAGGDDEAGAGITVELTNVMVSKATCDALAPDLAATLHKLVGHRYLRQSTGPTHGDKRERVAR